MAELGGLGVMEEVVVRGVMAEGAATEETESPVDAT
jgi:hypothetical protein